MGLNYVPLILDLYDGAGNLPSSGFASFVPSAVLADPADHVMVARSPVTADFTGVTSPPMVLLLATDNSPLAPAGWAWQASFGGPVNGPVAAGRFPGAPPSFSFFLPANALSFSATHATPCVFTAAGSAFANGDAVMLSGSSLPAGFDAGTVYYVVSASGTSFELAATAGGGAIASTSTGSGAVIAVQYLSALAPVSDVTTMAAYLPIDYPPGAAAGYLWTSNADGNGSWEPPGGYFAGKLRPVPKKTAGYLAQPGDFVPCDTTSTAFTVTLPDAPPDGTAVGAKLVIQGTGKNVTLAASGSDLFNKASGATTESLQLPDQGLIVQYQASAGLWYIYSDDLPLSQLDARYVKVLTGLAADNGVTDNWTALNTQLTAIAAAGGGTAVLPPATSYYGVAQDLVVPAKVTLAGTQPFKLKGPGPAIPTAGNCSGSNIGPAAGGSYSFGVVQLGGTNASLENIGVFGNGDHAVAGMVDAPVGVYLNGKASRLRYVLVWGGVLAAVDSVPGSAAQDSNLEDVVAINNLNNLGGVGNSGTPTPVTMTGGSATLLCSNTTGLHLGQSVHSADNDGKIAPWSYIVSIVANTSITVNNAVSASVGSGVSGNVMIGANWVTAPGSTTTNLSQQIVLPNADTLAAIEAMPGGGIGASVMGPYANDSVITAVTPTGSQVATLASSVSGTTVTQLPLTVASVTSPIPPGRYVLNDGSGHTATVTIYNSQVATLSTTLSTGSPITSLPVTSLAYAVGAGVISTTYTDGSGNVYNQNFTTTGAAAGATSIPVSSVTPNYAYPSTALTSAGVLAGAGLATVSSFTTSGITYPIGATLSTPNNTLTISATANTSSTNAPCDFMTGHALRLQGGSDMMLSRVRTLQGTVILGGADTTCMQCHCSNGSALAIFNVVACTSGGLSMTGCIIDSAVPASATVRRDLGNVLITGSEILNNNNNVLPSIPTSYPALWDNGADGKGFNLAGAQLPKGGADGFSALINFGPLATPGGSMVSGVIAASGTLQTGTGQPYTGTSGLPSVSRGILVGGTLVAENPSSTLTYQSGALAASPGGDIALTNALATVITTASLAPGTWIIDATVLCQQATASTASTYEGEVTSSGSATFTSSGPLAADASGPSNSTAGHQVATLRFHFAVVVTVAGTVTIAAKNTSNNGSASAKGSTPDSSFAGATGYTALKIA